MDDPARTNQELLEENASLKQKIQDMGRSDSDRKQAEESPKQSEEKFRSIAESSRDFIMRYDRQCRHTYMNPAALKISGLAGSDIIGKTHRESGFPEDLSAVWEEKITQVFKTAEPHQAEFEWNSAHGSVYLDWQLTPEFDSEGRMHSVLGVSRDITKRKRAEEALKENERRLHMIVEHVNDAFYVHDLEGNITDLNDNACRMIDYTREELLAPGGLFLIDAPMNSELTQERLSSLMRDGFLVFEGQHKRKDGKMVDVNVSARIVSRDGKGIVQSFVSDITERKHTEEELRKSAENYKSLASTADSMFILDRNYIMTFANEHLLRRIRPHVSGPIIGESIDAIFHPSQTISMRRGVDEVFSTGEHYYDEIWGHYAKTYFARTFSPVFDENGNVTAVTVASKDMTKYKLAEMELQQSEEQYRSLASISDRVFVVDKDCRHLFANDAYLDTFGPARGSVIGRRYDELNDEKLSREFTDAVRYVFETGDVYQYEFKGSRTGTDFLRRISSIKSIEGGISAATVISVDITERKQAEEKIILLNERISTATRSAQVGIWDWDVVNNHLEWDDQMYALYGENKEDFSGAYEAWIKGLHPDDRSYCDAESKKALLGEKEYDTEFRVVWPDGSVRFIKAKGEVFRDADGKPLRMIGVNYDITERKHAVELLLESEMMNRELLESINDAFFSLDDNMVVKYFNPAAERVLNKKAGEVIGLCLFDAFPEARGSVFEKNYSQCIRNREALVFEVEFTIPPYENWYDVRVYPAKNGISVFFQVTTDRKRLEKERLTMERQLLHSQKLESLGVLAGGIAHDFNNLLMAILGNLELAMEEISPVSSARLYLENSHKASRRAADLTRQMLAYSGKGGFVVENMNLSELVQENIHMFRSSIPATITLDLNLNREIPLLIGDSGQIQQVVMNLITNAAEAIGDDAGVIILTTGVQNCDEGCLKQSRLQEKPAPGDYVYLEVRDTGCGMDEETQQKIFDPFFTTKFTGRGLGMSALQGIILGHKGAIFLDSTSGGGTTIRVIFPVSDAI